DYILKQQAFAALDSGDDIDESLFEEFSNSDIHQVLKVCADLRPSVDISVVKTHRG
ncbi:MAG: ketol-acid reductoisomerase, partial [Rhodospirillaceae bacterium]|nr:ketol-acid reductoisomerase [Rhodospirillaceae bacterium]